MGWGVVLNHGDTENTERKGKRMKDFKQVWSCGGGTQSCAIAALIVRGDLPKPDLAAIADTGYERATTWNYLDEVLRPALATVGVEIHSVKAAEWAKPSMRGVFSNPGTLLIPAYTNESGEIGKFSSFCSGAWKANAVDRWLSQTHGITRSKCVKWIGFSYDEARRVNRMREGAEFKAGLIRFPLIDDVLTNRAQAIALVEEMGWPTPPRSNCWMCPNQGDHEWRSLPPAEFLQAVEFEREIQKRDPNAFLHRSCTPLDKVNFEEEEDLFSRPCDSGMCFI